MERSGTAGQLVGYARVSTEEQNLDMQIKALLRAGVHEDRIHVEKRSGASSKRPRLDLAIENLRAGDTLVVWRLDRIARSLQQLLHRLEQLEQKKCGLMSLTEHVDTTTPSGRFMIQMAGAFAEFERQLIAQRTRAGVAAARERGVQIGAKPLLSPKQRLIAQRMRNAGKSIRQVAAHFRVSPQTIVNWTDGPRGGKARLLRSKK